MTEQDLERAVCAAICRGKGLRAREIAAELGLDHKTVNRALYGSPLMKELCWQDRDFRWHGLVRQDRPHAGLEEFAGWYGTAEQFTALSEAEWMAQLTKGCGDVGRNLNDTRGLLHSFRDCRAAMLGLFRDLREMLGDECLAWELAFELRLKRARYVRIYADVLVITDSRVFSLEFKMKDKIDPEELKQAAKYTPYLEIVFGLDYEIIPVLVLTAAAEFFDFVRLEGEDRLVPVCSGDILFNVFDEYMGFLQ